MTAREELAKKKQKVLWITLGLNIFVSLLKIITGLFTGLLNLIADGIHSLCDSSNNIVGIAAIHISKRPPDEKFPYDYSKFEAGAVIVVCIFIFEVFRDILVRSYEKLTNPQPLSFGYFPFVVMVITIMINLAVVRYEKKKGVELKSEILKADAAHTKSDVYVSLGVIASLIFIKMGWGLMDPIASIVIAIFIFKLLLEQAKPAIKILCGAAVVPSAEVEKIIMAVPEVKFCHKIRSHGQESSFYIDCDIGVYENLTVKHAHNYIGNSVKEALKKHYPHLKDINVHIEPDDEESRTRKNSVFKEEET